MPAVNGSSVALKPLKATMKAHQFDPRDKKIHLNEVPVPKPEPHQILVQIVTATLCHSDFLVLHGTYSDEPRTMGHEATALVVEPGSAVQGFKSGDKVGFICMVDCCFECETCKTWSPMNCKKGVNVQGFALDGYYAEYAVVDARNTMILPDNLDITKAAPLFCAGVTAFHGVEECQLKEGQWVAVVGAGGLGQLGVQYAKAMGLKVIAIDVHDAQLEEAKTVGADHIFNSKSDADYVRKILDLTDGGVDAAINFTASKAAYSSMPPMIRPVTGVLMVVGVASQPLEFDSFALTFRHFIIKGACNGTCYNMVPAIEFSAKHNIQPAVDFFDVGELPEMMRKMESGEARCRMGIRFS